MSELITTQSRIHETRWHLLSTVSSLALVMSLCTAAQAAGDTDRPTVWIELGAQLDRIQGSETPFLPPFMQAYPRPYETVPSATTQRPPRYAIGGEGKLTFMPEGSDWSLVAAVRYGRSNSDKHLHQQTTEVRQSGVVGRERVPFIAHLTRFGDTVSSHKSSYLIADFTAGHDVGLGSWRGNSAPTVDFGVRFAQFTTRSTATLRDRPDPFFERIPLPPTPFLPSLPKYQTNRHNHSFYGRSNIDRSFSGIGPTLSLNGSQSLVGSAENGEFTFDWGANAAVLFGRQKVRGSHRSSGAYFVNEGEGPVSVNRPPAKSVNRSRAVAVPNLGGFAGASLRFTNAKVSLGYRADFFFGAMDGGVDTRDTSNRSFHGPFATISVGL
ncbi:MAG TPA: hypothetical protein VL026_14540 [Rhizomicrobium sp.]|nr:hypothetical protein [Rhizomicrobium sp.]